jgi:triphosphatase
MADEIEIKLRAPREVLQAARTLPWLRAMASGPGKRKRLRSVYFDTPKFELRDAGIALRVRHDGQKRLQTVKAAGEGAFTRKEWECRIDGDVPDLERLDNEARAALKDLRLECNLRPVFETDIVRTAIPLRYAASEIEIAFDFGVIRAGRRRETVSEIEIELKGGDPSAMVELAKRIADDLPVVLEPRAKPARGYALLAACGR